VSALLAIPESLLGGPLGPAALALTVGGLLLLAVRFALTVPAGETIRRRVHAHAATGTGAPGGAVTRPREALSRLRADLEEALADTAFATWVERLVERTGRRVRPVDFVLFSATIALGLASLAGTAAGLGGGLVGAVAGALFPALVAHVLAGRRARAFDEQLPAVLLTLSASLRVGHSFGRAMQAVADEGRPPASEEFGRVLAELRLGKPVEAALADLGGRVRSENLQFVLTSVTIQREIGGSLASLLETVAETVRERHQLARKLSALTAMGRASAIVLVALPFAAALGLSALNPDYMRPLYTTSAGRMLIVIGLVMMGLGSLILKRIVSPGR
jgi:tight adherence protein B